MRAALPFLIALALVAGVLAVVAASAYGASAFGHGALERDLAYYCDRGVPLMDAECEATRIQLARSTAQVWSELNEMLPAAFAIVIGVLLAGPVLVTAVLVRLVLAIAAGLGLAFGALRRAFASVPRPV